MYRRRFAFTVKVVGGSRLMVMISLVMHDLLEAIPGLAEHVRLRADS